MPRQLIPDSDERRDMVVKIKNDWRADVDARSDWLQDKELWVLLYNNVPPSSVPRYPGEPNFVVPVVMTTKETLHSRMVNSIFGLDSIAQARPFGKTDPKRLKLITEFMDWEMLVEMKFDEVVDNWIGDILMFGISAMWIRWRRETRKDRRIETFPANIQPMFPAMREVFQELKIPIKEGFITDKDYIDVLFDDTTVNSIGEGLYDVSYPKDGVEQNIEVFIDRSLIEDEGIVEVEITEVITVYDGPWASVIDVEDFIVPPGYDDIQTAPHIFHRRWMDYDEIAQMARRGIYDISDERLEQLKTKTEHKNSSNTGDAKEDRLRRQRSENVGVEHNETRRMSFEVIDAYYSLDIDDDGLEEEVVFTIIPDEMLYLNGQYLSVSYPHRKRPFTVGRIIPRTNQFEGIGIPEMVAPFQEEFSAIFNAKIRKDDFTSTPWGMYRPGSGMKNREIRIEPGVLFPSDNPREDLNIATMPASSIADVGNIQMLTQFLERLTGVSDFATGTFGSRPNAPRTFGATAAIIQEGNVRFSTYIRRIQRSLGEGMEQIHALNHIFMPESKEFFVMGENSPKKITRDHLSGRFSYMLTTNTQNTNKAVMRDFATFVYNGLLANPLIANNVGALYRLAKMYAEHHEVRNFDEILPEPPEAQQRPPMDQLTEIAKMAQGEPLQILPIDNDEEHIEIMMIFLEGPNADSFPREFLPIFMSHLQQHNQQMQLKQGQAGGGQGQVAGVQPGPEASQGFQGGEEAPGPNSESTNIGAAV